MLWNQARKYLCMKDKELSRIIRKYVESLYQEITHSTHYVNQ